MRPAHDEIVEEPALTAIEGVTTGGAQEADSDAGVSYVLVLVALAVLVGLIALLFFGLPNLAGPANVNVTIRQP